jgi:hypothetical protein
MVDLLLLFLQALNEVVTTVSARKAADKQAGFTEGEPAAAARNTLYCSVLYVSIFKQTSQCKPNCVVDSCMPAFAALCVLHLLPPQPKCSRCLTCWCPAAEQRRSAGTWWRSAWGGWRCCTLRRCWHACAQVGGALPCNLQSKVYIDLLKLLTTLYNDLLKLLTTLYLCLSDFVVTVGWGSALLLNCCEQCAWELQIAHQFVRVCCAEAVLPGSCFSTLLCHCSTCRSFQSTSAVDPYSFAVCCRSEE